MGERKYPTAVLSSLTEKYPTLVPSRHPVPPKAGDRGWLGSTCEVHSSEAQDQKKTEIYS